MAHRHLLHLDRRERELAEGTKDKGKGPAKGHPSGELILEHANKAIRANEDQPTSIELKQLEKRKISLTYHAGGPPSLGPAREDPIPRPDADSFSRTLYLPKAWIGSPNSASQGPARRRRSRRLSRTLTENYQPTAGHVASARRMPSSFSAASVQQNFVPPVTI